MRAAGDDAHGRRLRGLIVILWRAGLRIQEALALTEGDLDQRRGSLLVRRGKGGRRREVGMDDWGWQELQPWLERRLDLPVGPLLCVITGSTGGQPWATPRPARSSAAPRRRPECVAASRRTSSARPRRRRAREGVPLIVIQRQLGHSTLGITSVYLQGMTTPRSSTPSKPARTDGACERDAPALGIRRRRTAPDGGGRYAGTRPASA